MRAASGITTASRTFSNRKGDPTPSVTASLIVALSDGLLESAYLDDVESVPSLVREAVTRLLDRS
jgi:hypothetical protein